MNNGKIVSYGDNFHQKMRERERERIVLKKKSLPKWK
jgi:hypothetical protein